MTDARPPLDAALDAFSLPAVVTPPGGDAVTTRGFWLPPTTVPVPDGSPLQQTERRRVLVLPLAAVPSIPIGTVVQMPEYEDGPDGWWSVDSTIDGGDFDHRRVVVVPTDPVT